MISTQTALQVCRTQMLKLPPAGEQSLMPHLEPTVPDNSENTIRADYNGEKADCQPVALSDLDAVSGIRLEAVWFTSIVESSPDCIATIDFDGAWLSLNSAGQALLGMSGVEHWNGGVKSVVTEHDRAFVQTQVLPTVMQSGAWRGQLCFQTVETGLQLKLDCQWFLVRDRLTQQPLCIAMINRVSPGDTATENLESAPATPSKSQVFAEFSHELRTPLAVIASSAGILETMGDRLDQSKKQKHFQRIRTKVAQATQLLEDILLLSRTEEGQSLHRVWVNPIELCRELVEEVQLSTQHHEITLCVGCGYSRSEAAYKVLVDQVLLQRILTNLLSNSIKYSPAGGRIDLRLICETEKVVFEIQDEGIGIPADDQVRLFETFYRASNVAAIQGTGLGLAIVKKCVELHHGRIDVRSRIGCGTTFRIEIPNR